MQIIKTCDLPLLGQLFLKKPWCPKLGAQDLISDTTVIFLYLDGIRPTTPNFGHFWYLKKKLWAWGLFFQSFYSKKCHNKQKNVDKNDFFTEYCT